MSNPIVCAHVFRMVALENTKILQLSLRVTSQDQVESAWILSRGTFTKKPMLYISVCFSMNFIMLIVYSARLKMDHKAAMWTESSAMLCNVRTNVHIYL